MTLNELFSEDEIVKVKGITHAEYRKSLKEETPLTPGAAKAVLHDELSDINKLARKYRTTTGEIRAALRGVIVDHARIKELEVQGLTRQEIAERLQLPISLVPEQKDPKRNLYAEIGALTDKGYLQEEIARELNITQSAVSKYNPYRKSLCRKVRRPDAEEWALILSHFREHNNMSETARKYNISRAAIYNRLKRDA